MAMKEIKITLQVTYLVEFDNTTRTKEEVGGILLNNVRGWLPTTYEAGAEYTPMSVSILDKES